MSGFICPICKKALKNEKSRLVCPQNHSFDKAAEGYSYLLPANKKNSKIPGDNKEMVSARRSFLEKDYYKLFSDKICEIAIELLGEKANPTVLDAGCGEGYYTSQLNIELAKSFDRYSLLGFDISKFAIKAAAKKYHDIQFAVASSFDMPVADKSVDLMINIFAPICEKELARVIKKDGYFLYAVPTPKHLFSLKAVLYDKPYENERYDKPYKGFKLCKRVTVEGTINLPDTETILQLFSMTPYYYKTSEQGSEKLSELSFLQTEIGFDILIFQKA